MKITDVEIHVASPLGDEVNFSGRVSWVFVQVHTDEGVSGIGECSNFPRKGNSAVVAALEAVREGLIGRDPARIEAIWHDLFRQFTFLGSRGLATTVASGIDMALWDIKGKALGRPVHDLLGGAVRDSIPLYTHPGGASWEEVAERSARLAGEGWEAFKYDPFAGSGPRVTSYVDGEIAKADVRRAAELVERIRDAVGPDVEMLIDFHGNYNVSSALRCIRALEPYDIGWFEEPLQPENTDALRQLRAQTDAPLCVGERLYTRWDFLPILRDRLANYLMPDVCWTGGISELRKIATMAEAHAVPVAPHGALGPLQTVASSHAMLATTNFFRLEILGPDWISLYDAALQEPLDVRDGRLHVSDRPGLGAELDPDWLRAHPRPDWV
ncbi:MAG TPA: mandelate racemase/muconate lactonizing enzyme family protein [Gaiellaceae bacterium]|nr:mandelate racemase/muconate lactonizing enzyme family protein [Gaiellaceae bacterium]